MLSKLKQFQKFILTHSKVILSIIFGLAILLLIIKIQSYEFPENFLKRLVVWLFFSVIISLIPLCFDFFFRLIREKKMPKTHELIDRGQLYILNVVIGAATLGEILILPREINFIEVVLAFTLLVIVLVSAGFYPFSYIVNAQRIVINEEKNNSRGSIFFFNWFPRLNRKEKIPKEGNINVGKEYYKYSIVCFEFTVGIGFLCQFFLNL